MANVGLGNATYGTRQIVKRHDFKKALASREQTLEAMKNLVGDQGALAMQDLFTSHTIAKIQQAAPDETIGNPILDQDLEDLVAATMVSTDPESGTLLFTAIRDNFFEGLSDKVYLDRIDADKVVNFTVSGQPQTAQMFDLVQTYAGILRNMSYSTGNNILGDYLKGVIDNSDVSDYGSERIFLYNTLNMLLDETISNLSTAHTITPVVIMRDLELSGKTVAKMIVLLRGSNDPICQDLLESFLKSVHLLDNSGEIRGYVEEMDEATFSQQILAASQAGEDSEVEEPTAADEAAAAERGAERGVGTDQVIDLIGPEDTAEAATREKEAREATIAHAEEQEAKEEAEPEDTVDEWE
ncbi:MAG: hypothetical protein HQ564_04495 [Candidatus Saganbacteria bacterium]|nr:hypothetical protein [Candidatus Saganbacteria bacterium]